MLLRGGFKFKGVNDLFVNANNPIIVLSPIEFVFVFRFPFGVEPKDEEKVLL